MDDIGDAPPDFKISTKGNLNRWIGRVFRFEKHLPAVDDLQTLQGKIFAQPGHDNLIVCRGDRPIDYDNVLISDTGAIHLDLILQLLSYGTPDSDEEAQIMIHLGDPALHLSIP